MNDKQQILVIVGPDNHPQEVVDRAAWLAGHSGCDLMLLWCDPDIGPLAGSFLVSNEAQDISEKIMEAQKELVEELAVSARQQGLRVNTDVLEERPIADGILYRVRDMNPAYLVKGTHYHAAAERSIFAHTDWQLMRSCQCPLWLVKPPKLREQPIIIASVDPIHSHDKPAALDQVIVGYAKRIAAFADGEVHLLHTYDPLTAVGAAVARTIKPIKIAVDKIGNEVREEHQQKLNELADSCDIDEAHTHQLPGAARELIPAFVRSENADLVVMGALARWGLKRAVIGSTAERVLDQLPCDILIVRADG